MILGKCNCYGEVGEEGKPPYNVSNVAWHHINRTTTVPIRVCRNCNLTLSGQDLIVLNLMEMIQEGNE